jgi:hypothetical protein
MNVPDKWLVVQFNDTFKVFMTWEGRYLGKDEWRMNSGIVRIEDDEDYYLFYGHSGSCYHCKKPSYGTTGYGLTVLHGFQRTIDKFPDANFMKILDDESDWVKFFEDKVY